MTGNSLSLAGRDKLKKRQTLDLAVWCLEYLFGRTTTANKVNHVDAVAQLPALCLIRNLGPRACKEAAFGPFGRGDGVLSSACRQRDTEHQDRLPHFVLALSLGVALLVLLQGVWWSHWGGGSDKGSLMLPSVPWGFGLGREGAYSSGGGRAERKYS